MSGDQKVLAQLSEVKAMGSEYAMVARFQRLATENGQEVEVRFGTEHSYILVGTTTVELSSAQAEQLDAGLKAEKQDGTKEIERKFLVDTSRLPAGWDDAPAGIAQGYIALDASGTEIRVRQKGNKFYFTVKGDGTLIRSEVEIELTSEQYEQLMPLAQDRTVEKIRYTLPYTYTTADGASATVTLEIDKYAGNLDGLYTVEVEFPSEEAAKQFVPPPFFGRDVTAEKNLKNKKLAGLPRAKAQALITSL